MTHFGSLLYNLWNKNKTDEYFQPNALKYAIGKANMMFKGMSQHDSSEFLAWLLDQLHEDLNRVLKNPYIEMPDLKGSDEQVSNTFWETHLQRNQSIVVDLFSGQFKSSTTCPHCKYQKTQFEPYTTI